MPNWCSNVLNISSPTKKEAKKIVDFIRTIKDGEVNNFDFNNVIPMPEELVDTTANGGMNLTDAEKERLTGLYGAFDWYDWSVKNWGTKWGACDADIAEISPKEYSIQFQTAWSPPVPVIDKLGELFPKSTFKMTYIEEGCGFAGVTTSFGGETSDSCLQPGQDGYDEIRREMGMPDEEDYGEDEDQSDYGIVDEDED